MAAQQELAATGPQLGSDYLLWADAQVQEARGRPDASLATLLQAWDLCTSQGLTSTLPLLGTGPSRPPPRSKTWPTATLAWPG